MKLQSERILTCLWLEWAILSEAESICGSSEVLLMLRICSKIVSMSSF
jgi:hypothetical protein